MIFRRVLADATIQLPNRLLIIYKRRNAAELLKLFLDFDRVEEAVSLATELVDAYLGRGNEVFSLEQSLHAAGAAATVCVPVTYIDQLRYSLKNSRSGDVFRAQLSEKLENKINEYLQALTLRSRDCVTYSRQTMRISGSGGGSAMELS